MNENHTAVMGKKFSSAFLAGFAIVIVAVISLGNRTFIKLFPSLHQRLNQINENLDTDLADALNANEIDRDSRSAAVAKKNRLFWASTGKGAVGGAPAKGVALRLLENERLFHGLFPGYPLEMSRDQELWEKYFTREFVPSIWLAGVSGASKYGVSVFASWTGCFDIYRRYGADIIIVGSSEVFRGISPDLLAQQLDQSGIPALTQQKILMCVTGGSPMDIIEATAKELKRVGPMFRPKRVIWGFSFWHTYLASPFIHHVSTGQLANFHAYQRNEGASESLSRAWKGADRASLSQLATGFNWDTVLEPSFQKIRELQARERVTQREDKLVDQLLQDQPEKLNQVVEQIVPSYGGLEDITEKDCDLTHAQIQFGRTLSAFEDLAEKVMVYVTPTTPLQINAAPPCLIQNTRKMVSAAAGRQVQVSVADWKQYGLSYREYLSPAVTPGKLRLDSHHTNFQGASIVTRQIARWIIESERGQ